MQCGKSILLNGGTFAVIEAMKVLNVMIKHTPNHIQMVSFYRTEFESYTEQINKQRTQSAWKEICTGTKKMRIYLIRCEVE